MDENVQVWRKRLYSGYVNFDSRIVRPKVDFLLLKDFAGILGFQGYGLFPRIQARKIEKLLYEGLQVVGTIEDDLYVSIVGLGGLGNLVSQTFGVPSNNRKRCAQIVRNVGYELFPGLEVSLLKGQGTLELNPHFFEGLRKVGYFFIPLDRDSPGKVTFAHAKGTLLESRKGL